MLMNRAMGPHVNANVSDILAYIPVDSEIQSEITLLDAMRASTLLSPSKKHVHDRGPLISMRP